MGSFHDIDLDVVMVLIGVLVAVLSLVGTALTVWFASARERRMYRDQQNILERMLQQHAFEKLKSGPEQS